MLLHQQLKKKDLLRVTRMANRADLSSLRLLEDARGARFPQPALFRELYIPCGQEGARGTRSPFISSPSSDPLPVTSINQRYRGFPSALITIMIPAHTPDKDPNTDAGLESEMFTIRLSPGTLGHQSLSSCYLLYEKSRTQSTFPPTPPPHAGLALTLSSHLVRSTV